ncbi:long chain fatty acid CoA ligase-like protein, partial [Leptotrombidium deliense]
MSEESCGVCVGLGILKVFICVYDTVTLPIYYLCQRPWNAMRLNKAIRAVRMKPEDPYSPYVRIGEAPSHPILVCETVPKLFKKTVEVYGKRKCLGQREALSEEEAQEDGKTLQKLNLGEYKWLTYIEMDQRIDIVAKGLMAIGVKPKDTLMMLADTRLEWFLTAQAVFRIGSAIATLYTTLGLDGIVHGINETSVTHMVTTVDFLPKLKQIISKTPTLKTVIYIEGLKKPETDGFTIELLPFSQLEKKGKSGKDTKFGEVKPSDPAVIMYTSGSTGIPKGVILTHKNLIGTIRGFFAVANVLADVHVYIAFLPLAHVLELAAESFFIAIGVTIGYSSPNTMTDKSTAIKKGAKGDASLLRPTVMAAVPLVLDRIRKAVGTLLESKSGFVRSLFYYLLDYKT